MAKKFALVPFRENLETVPSVLESDKSDDEKVKRIVALLTTLLAKPTSEEETSQTTEEVSTQTAENVDSEAVVSYLGKSYRQKARGLLRFLKRRITWLPHSFEIMIGDRLLPGSNIIDLTYYLLSSSKKLSIPEGFFELLPVISKLNLPKTLVAEDRLKRSSRRLEAKRWANLD